MFNGVDDKADGARENLKARYSILARYQFAILTGAMVLFPTITGAFQPPFVLNFFLFSFWFFAIPGILFLAVAFYLSTGVCVKEEKWPAVETWLHRSGGLGNWFSLLALISLIVYAVSNLYNDHTSAPRITLIEANPRIVEQGHWVKLSAFADDQDRDALSWRWEHDQQILGSRRQIAWHIPNNEPIGEKEVTLTVSDGEKIDDAKIKLIIKKKVSKVSIRNQKLEELEHYVDNRVRAYFARRARDNPGLNEDVEKVVKLLTTAAVENIQSLEAIRDDPTAIPEALDAYFRIDDDDQIVGLRLPKCNEYPLIWPFCKK